MAVRMQDSKLQLEMQATRQWLQVRHLCRVVLSSDCPVQVLVDGGCPGLVVVLAARARGWRLPCLKAPADSCRGCRWQQGWEKESELCVPVRGPLI